MTHYRHPPGAATIRFVRHGATAANLAGLRCGGDLDPPLAEPGRRQAAEVAQRLAALVPTPGVIVTSDLRRTRETAAIIAQVLGHLPVVVEAGWAERGLGEWNLRTVAETQDALLARCTPPGGEPDAVFTQRIRTAVRGLTPLLARRPLLVGSSGVARVLGELCGLATRVELDNGGQYAFDLSTLIGLEPAWETP